MIGLIMITSHSVLYGFQFLTGCIRQNQARPVDVTFALKGYVDMYVPT